MLCNREKCPILEKLKFLKKLETSEKIEGETVSVMIGHYNYPKVFAGPLTGRSLLLEKDPSNWIEKSIKEIIAYRCSLIRGKKPVKVADVNSKQVEPLQEIALSRKEVMTEVEYFEKPKPVLSFSSTTAPYGPSAGFKKIIIEENPKVPRAVDRIVNDEVKAVEAVSFLHSKGISVNQIQELFSVGLLGIKRKLVPTRWSITAVDDTASKNLLEKIREYKKLEDYLVFTSEYLSNHFEVIMLPASWSYEQIEYYSPGSTWVEPWEKPVIMQDWEGFRGRKNYAENVEGGYYAARLSVTEYLEKIKRQASVIVLREIRKGYYAPLGVWQVRENVRKALESKPEKYSSFEELAEAVSSRISFKTWVKHSRLALLEKSRKMLIKFM